MVAGLGVEPRFADYEPAVIPIHFPATLILQVGVILGKWAFLLGFRAAGQNYPQDLAAISWDELFLKPSAKHLANFLNRYTKKPQDNDYNQDNNSPFQNGLIGLGFE